MCGRPHHLCRYRWGLRVLRAGLHVGAEVVAALERLPASEGEEPQELPASAAHFGQSPLPGSLGAKSENMAKGDYSVS